MAYLVFVIGILEFSAAVVCLAAPSSARVFVARVLANSTLVTWCGWIFMTAAGAAIFTHNTTNAWFDYIAYGLAGITTFKGAYLIIAPRDSLSFFRKFYAELSDNGYRGLGILAIGVSLLCLYTANKLSL